MSKYSPVTPEPKPVFPDAQLIELIDAVAQDLEDCILNLASPEARIIDALAAAVQAARDETDRRSKRQWQKIILKVPGRARRPDESRRQ